VLYIAKRVDKSQVERGNSMLRHNVRNDGGFVGEIAAAAEMRMTCLMIMLLLLLLLLTAKLLLQLYLRQMLLLLQTFRLLLLIIKTLQILRNTVHGHVHALCSSLQSSITVNRLDCEHSYGPLLLRTFVSS
jgi:hypothetical protein